MAIVLPVTQPYKLMSTAQRPAWRDSSQSNNPWMQALLPHAALHKTIVWVNQTQRGYLRNTDTSLFHRNWYSWSSFNRQFVLHRTCHHTKAPFSIYRSSSHYLSYQSATRDFNQCCTTPRILPTAFSTRPRNMTMLPAERQESLHSIWDEGRKWAYYCSWHQCCHCLKSKATPFCQSYQLAAPSFLSHEVEFWWFHCKWK